MRPESSPYSNKSILVVRAEGTSGRNGPDVSRMVTSKLPYRVVDIDDLGDKLDLLGCSEGPGGSGRRVLADLDVGIVLAISSVNFKHDVLQDAPAVDVCIETQWTKCAKKWEWKFLSLAEANIALHDPRANSTIFTGRYPPPDADSYKRVPGDPLRNAPYSVYVYYGGRESVIDTKRPGDLHFQAADSKALDKLVDYVVTSLKRSERGRAPSGSAGGVSDVGCSTTFMDGPLRTLAQRVGAEMKGHNKQVLAIGRVGSVGGSIDRTRRIERMLRDHLEEVREVEIVPSEMSQKIADLLGPRGAAGDSDPDIAAEIGRLSNSDAILYGTIRETRQGMSIGVRLYDTDSGRLFSESDVEIDKDRIISSAVRGLVP